jgi:hypothetical protein
MKLKSMKVLGLEPSPELLAISMGMWNPQSFMSTHKIAPIENVTNLCCSVLCTGAALPISIGPVILFQR